jgi:hypothetical protein
MTAPRKPKATVTVAPETERPPRIPPIETRVVKVSVVPAPVPEAERCRHENTIPLDFECMDCGFNSTAPAPEPSAGERIVAAAILIDDTLIVTAPPRARHGDILHPLFLRYGIRAGEFQGFLTSTGRFVDRTEAYRIAIASGQPWTDARHVEGTLFSEDLW